MDPTGHLAAYQAYCPQKSLKSQMFRMINPWSPKFREISGRHDWQYKRCNRWYLKQRCILIIVYRKDKYNHNIRNKCIIQLSKHVNTNYRYAWIHCHLNWSYNIKLDCFLLFSDWNTLITVISSYFKRCFAPPMVVRTTFGHGNT